MTSLLVLTAVVASGHDVAIVDNRPQLVGTVQTKNGRGIASATIFVSTAGPREGIGVL